MKRIVPALAVLVGTICLPLSAHSREPVPSNTEQPALGTVEADASPVPSAIDSPIPTPTRTPPARRDTGWIVIHTVRDGSFSVEGELPDVNFDRLTRVIYAGTSVLLVVVATPPEIRSAIEIAERAKAGRWHLEVWVIHDAKQRPTGTPSSELPVATVDSRGQVTLGGQPLRTKTRIETVLPGGCSATTWIRIEPVNASNGSVLWIARRLASDSCGVYVDFPYDLAPTPAPTPE